MLDTGLRLRIITPSAIKVDEVVDMVIARCITGDIGFLPGHASFRVALDIGALRLVREQITRTIMVVGGIARMEDDVLTVFTSIAEWPEEIDLARANEERARVLRRLQSDADDVDIQRDQVLLRRALVRIEIGGGSAGTDPSFVDDE